jgi:broad specificity phosphatase PhoE
MPARQERAMGHWLGAFLLGAAALSACASAQAPEAREPRIVEAKQVFVIRHMQKAAGDDPSLTAEGAAGAQRLADLLADDGIVAIFASRTKRAMETATPLARRLGITVVTYDPRHPEPMASAVAAARGSVLVVGHSNTVHDLVGRFGAPPPPPLTEEDYGTVFVVQADGGVTTFEVR